MRTRTAIAALVFLPVNAVLFGVGAVAVLSIPALQVNAAVLLPAVIVASFVISPFVSWYIAPRLRSRWQREHASAEGHSLGT
ncbi:MAG: hypothetical protein JNN24_00185 [Hyphomicrobium zavarzinii]|jgi:hypothetical protein|uniref:hypothetical protein n=1 Tax=Hyphomicrobium TaxID=81 RepID=UPI001A4A3365|nr:MULTISPECIES: hypothetical protein [Hyphomicrobium]MBL8844160.1 hypothetical protein [Hyphomicrobium zavarzinii]WBT39462.1 hypothetical protein PE058_06140 [Hyphomicrobium sp. DMF-1]HML43475.1 hypothetical protein [Hyphomicrobium zavarzinii]